MPRLACLGCARVGPVADTLVRVYRSSLQTEYRVQLCSACFWAMMDLYAVSSSAIQDGLGVGVQRKKRTRKRDMYSNLQ
jgi:hypothetical protein